MEQANIQPEVISLQNVVTRVIASLSSVANRNNSSIVNDIPAKLDVGRESSAVASVIGGLLRTVISNARESRIHVTAKELYGKMIMLCVKDANSFDTYGVACGLQDIVPMAQKIGGKLDIMSERTATTIELRYPIGPSDNPPISYYN